jgi:hypothetical protein
LLDLEQSNASRRQQEAEKAKREAASRRRRAEHLEDELKRNKETTKATADERDTLRDQLAESNKAHARLLEKHRGTVSSYIRVLEALNNQPGYVVKGWSNLKGLTQAFQQLRLEPDATLDQIKLARHFWAYIYSGSHLPPGLKKKMEKAGLNGEVMLTPGAQEMNSACDLWVEHLKTQSN